jgi:hypothetical protein
VRKPNLAYYLNGIPFEKYICRFFELTGLGSQYDHNSFSPSLYVNDNHNIVDGVLENKALFEMTNPKETTFLSDEIMLNKLDYFTRKDPKHFLIWFLIVSFANFSSFITQLIDKLGITLIVIGRHADPTNRATFIRALFRSKLYSTAKRLKGKVKKSGSGLEAQYSITSLPQYLCTSSLDPKQILNYLHRHSDTTENSTEEDNDRPIDRFPDKRRFIDEPRFSHY